MRVIAFFLSICIPLLARAQASTDKLAESQHHDGATDDAPPIQDTHWPGRLINSSPVIKLGQPIQFTSAWKNISGNAARVVISGDPPIDYGWNDGGYRLEIRDWSGSKVEEKPLEQRKSTVYRTFTLMVMIDGKPVGLDPRKFKRIEAGQEYVKADTVPLDQFELTEPGEYTLQLVCWTAYPCGYPPTNAITIQAVK